MDEVKIIPLKLITRPKVVMKLIRKGNVDYLELKDSIATHGLFNPISVREHPSKPGFYEIVDGFTRFSCCQDLGKETIPCIVKKLNDTETLIAQLQANSIRVETDKIEYARQLRRIQQSNPLMTLPELASLVGKRPGWVSSQLSLLDLIDDAQPLVSRGEIPISNAYYLAKLRPQYQKHLLEDAAMLPPSEFKNKVVELIHKLMAVAQDKSIIKGFAVDEAPHHGWMRSVSSTKRELRTLNAAPRILAEELAESPLDGWIAALKWVLHYDKLSQERVLKRTERKIIKAMVKRRSECEDVTTEPFSDILESDTPESENKQQ